MNRSQLRTRFSIPGRFDTGSRAVFDAVHTGSGRLLYLHVAATEDRAAKYALQYATSQLAAVQHAFFTTVHACGRATLDGREVCFTATERLRGQPLRQQVLAEEQVRRLMVGALEGLSVLHRSGSAHGGIEGGLRLVDGRLVCGRLPVEGATPAGDTRSLLDELARSLQPHTALWRELRHQMSGSAVPRTLARRLGHRREPVLSLAS